MIRTWLAGVLIAIATFINPPVAREKPLEKYAFENLAKREYEASEIKIDGNKFYFHSDGKKVSGTVTGKGPAIILLRGFATQEEYYPGFGTERMAAFLAKNGYATYAPDFLGYGESDKPSSDVFQERLETYTTVLNLISSICKFQISNCKLALWGHSNGGQIALSVLEISGKNIPTVLWNPVSKPFPYSILYYTDSFEDKGKALRANLAKFEADYDVEKYSTANFYDWIKAPILLQQGEIDPWVPKSWSDDLAKKINAKYIVYPGSDHNLMPLWDKAAKDLLTFLRSQ